MDLELQNELQSELGRDEKLLWTGRPASGIRFQPYDLFVIPFSLFWCGILLVGIVPGATKGRGLSFGSIFMIPFYAAGFYMLVGRFLVDARRRKNTIYGITNSRIIIRSGAFTRNIKSFNIKALTDMTLKEKRNGHGSIIIGPTDPRMMMMDTVPTLSGAMRTPALESIPEVRTVYQLILDLQRKGN